MEPRPGDRRIRPEWWALILVVLTVVFVVVTSAIFAGSFRSSVPVTLKSERSGLIMETNAKVKMRGVEVGRVGHVGASDGSAELQLELDPAQIQHIPANVEAQINATTAFGAKFVDLVYPENPAPNTSPRAQWCARAMSAPRSTPCSRTSSIWST